MFYYNSSNNLIYLSSKLFSNNFFSGIVKTLKYSIKKYQIQIFDNDEFNIKHILECGQVFRFKTTDFGYTLYAGVHKANVFCQKGTTTILCDDEKYFENYFDLKEDYAKIKCVLKKDKTLIDAVEYGKGIRILKQEPLEMLISFIISANNNIPRIKKIIEKICKDFGTNCGDYYAFPTLKQLQTIPLNYFKDIKCGYRDSYLFKTIAMLSDEKLIEISKMSTNNARIELMKFMGVGTKVADCILLFGYHKTNVYPTDTWIKKDYLEKYNLNLSSKKISDFYVKKYGKLSGFAQQYIYYYKSTRKIKRGK